jgi:integrase
MRLTERKIQDLNVEGEAKDRLVFDDVQRGLAVRITASGGRSYLAQYTLHGQKHRVPIGAVSALSLAKAREAAATVLGDVAHGKNPALERKEAAARARKVKDRLTLEALIGQWKTLHLSQRRPRYASEAERALRYAFKRYLDRAADDLDRATVVRVLDGLTSAAKAKGESGQTSLKGTSIASRTAAYGRAAFAWAVKRGGVENNPFANLPTMATPSKRDRVLSDDELANVWRAAGAASAPFGPIIRLLLLTGQRREEVAGIAWSELSDDLTKWTIPASRTKNGVPHIVPLSKPAQDLLRGANQQGKLVFPGLKGTPFSGWGKSKTELDTASKTSNWRIHDLRRTLATGLQRLGVRLEVTEAVLNHVSGSRAGIVGVYQRHDWASEKRAALDAWGNHVLTIAEGRAPSSKVVKVAFS